MTDGAERPAEPGAAEGAFDALFRREFGPITRTAYLVVGDWEVAREIAQDAFVQALRHWKKVQAMESPGGWVRRVAIRDAVRSRRRHARGARSGRRTTEAPEPAPLTLDVRTALLTLPAQRAVIALHYLDDRPVAEIAALLGCSRAPSRPICRGRDALAKLLGEEATDELR